MALPSSQRLQRTEPMEGGDRSVLARVFTVLAVWGSCKRPECGDMQPANQSGESCVQVAPVLWGQ